MPIHQDQFQALNLTENSIHMFQLLISQTRPNQSLTILTKLKIYNFSTGLVKQVFAGSSSILKIIALKTELSATHRADPVG